MMRHMLMRSAIVAGIGALCLSALLGAASTTPVADTAMRGDRDALRDLLKTGADVGAAQGDGMTALHWAAERGDAAMADMLVYAGANVSAVTRIGQYTPLHLASRAGSGTVVAALLKAGADATARATTTGVTALHLAASAGNADVVTLLLDAGADANAKESEWGQTPLMFAAAQNRPEAIKVLLARGADPKITTKFIEIAKQGQLDRAATEIQRKVLEASVPAGQQPTASQIQAAMQAAREILASGKIPPPPAPAAGRGGPATAGRRRQDRGPERAAGVRGEQFRPRRNQSARRHEGRPDGAAACRASGQSSKPRARSSTAARRSISKARATARRRS